MQKTYFSLISSNLRASRCKSRWITLRFFRTISSWVSTSFYHFLIKIIQKNKCLPSECLNSFAGEKTRTSPKDDCALIEPSSRWKEFWAGNMDIAVVADGDRPLAAGVCWDCCKGAMGALADVLPTGTEPTVVEGEYMFSWIRLSVSHKLIKLMWRCGGWSVTISGQQ